MEGLSADTAPQVEYRWTFCELAAKAKRSNGASTVAGAGFRRPRRKFQENGDRGRSWTLTLRAVTHHKYISPVRDVAELPDSAKARSGKRTLRCQVEIIARDIAKMHIHDDLPLPVLRYSRAWIVSLPIPWFSFEQKVHQRHALRRLVQWQVGSGPSIMKGSGAVKEKEETHNFMGILCFPTSAWVDGLGKGAFVFAASGIGSIRDSRDHNSLHGRTVP